jgi:hypothetical protein
LRLTGLSFRISGFSSGLATRNESECEPGLSTLTVPLIVSIASRSPRSSLVPFGCPSNFISSFVPSFRSLFELTCNLIWYSPGTGKSTETVASCSSTLRDVGVEPFFGPPSIDIKSTTTRFGRGV